MVKLKYLSNFDYFSLGSDALFNSLDCDYTQRPPTSFAIANNLLVLNARAIDLGISPRALTTTAWNNFENLKDRSSSMKHPKKCS